MFPKKWKHIAAFLSWFPLVILIIYFVKLYCDGVFNSVESLREYMNTFGVFAPLVLIVFQALQVLIPILPNYIGCIAGTLLFGPVLGFFCNYIGLSLGSVGAYYLARRFGMNIVMLMFSEKTYEKWSTRFKKSKSFDLIVFLCHALPLMPADFLSYFCGLIKSDEKKFWLLTLLGKPWGILLYSIVFAVI